MKYVQPHGISDIEGSYINGDPSIGRQGSIPPAAAFEHPMREIVGVIDKSKFIPSSTDLLQLMKATRSQRVNYVLDTGSVNSLSVALDPPVTAYTEGLPLRVLVKATCTGATTIDAGAGRVNIRKPNGAVTVAGDLTAGGLVELVYDGTAFQMINFGGAGAGGAGDTYITKLPYAVDTGVANAIVANFSPAIITLSAGDAVLVKITNTNTAATTLKCNALAAINVIAQGGGSLLPYDVLANSVFLFVYDGTQFHIIPNPTIDGSIQINVPTAQFPTPASVFSAIKRKFIAPTAIVTVKLASGVYAPFAIDHPSSNRLVVSGTMIGGNPTMGNFAQNGSSAGQRATDASTNLAMLRSRYGTEIQCPAGFHGTAIYVAAGTFPSITDVLVTAVTYQEVGAVNALGTNNVALSNCAVWGCWGGVYANATGNIVATNCWASGCQYGFVGGAGGTIGMGGGGAFGCEFGLVAQAAGHLECSSIVVRCCGTYGVMSNAGSSLNVTAGESILNGSFDCYCTGGSYMGVQVNAVTFSPALNTVGNNNSIIITV